MTLWDSFLVIIHSSALLEKKILQSLIKHKKTKVATNFVLTVPHHTHEKNIALTMVLYMLPEQNSNWPRGTDYGGYQQQQHQSVTKRHFTALLTLQKKSEGPSE
jgi:hypothetical protein